MNGDVLTAQTLRDAMELIRNQKPVPHVHVIHPREIDAEWARCADCFQVFSPRALREAKP